MFIASDIVDPTTLNAISQIVTAIGVIMTAVSSIMNRRKLNVVDQKVDRAVTVAAETKQEAAKTQRVATQKLEEVKEAVVEAKEAATAVNIEVMQKIHENGVEVGKALATNGHSDGSGH